MRKSEFIKEIAERCDLTKDKSAEVFQAFDDLINEVIATNDFVTFEFGTIEGKVSPPKELKGHIINEEKAKANGYWSNCRFGFPKITWSGDTRWCTIVRPKEWFEYVENRYSEEAKKFRERNSLPEIDLNNEDITQIIRMPDNIREMYDRYLERLSKGKKYKYRGVREQRAFDSQLKPMREKRKKKKENKEEN